MTATDTLRGVIRDLEAKAKELEIDKRLTTFADHADHYLRVAATRAGEYAADNRERVEATLDRAGAKVDEKTDGKYHAYVGRVRAGVLSGMDWVAEQRETVAPSDEAAGPGGRAPEAGAATASTASAASTASTASAASGGAGDTTSVGSADGDAWVDVTDTPQPGVGESAPGSDTDPR